MRYAVARMHLRWMFKMPRTQEFHAVATPPDIDAGVSGRAFRRGFEECERREPADVAHLDNRRFPFGVDSPARDGRSGRGAKRRARRRCVCAVSRSRLAEISRPCPTFLSLTGAALNVETKGERSRSRTRYGVYGVEDSSSFFPVPPWGVRYGN